MKNLEDILGKVQKMLDTKGRTPEEAALYVEKAHAILRQYDLSIEAVADLKADPRTAVRKADAGTRTTEGKPDSWKADLLIAVAEAFECKVLFEYKYEETKSGRLRRVKVAQIVGFGHDVEAAGYAQSFLVNEIIRLSKEYSRTHWDAIKQIAADRGITNHLAESIYVGRSGTHPLKAEIYFVKGAAQTVSESLSTEARRRRDVAARENPNALTVQKGAEVRDYIYQERYGMTYDEYQAKVKADQERWRAEYAAKNPQAVTKPETEAQRRKREEREARQSDRQSKAYWNRYYREQAKTDHDALRAGQAAGREIKIARGLPGSTNGGGIDG